MAFILCHSYTCCTSRTGVPETKTQGLPTSTFTYIYISWPSNSCVLELYNLEFETGEIAELRSKRKKTARSSNLDGGLLLCSAPVLFTSRSIRKRCELFSGWRIDCKDGSCGAPVFHSRALKDQKRGTGDMHNNTRTKPLPTTRILSELSRSRMNARRLQRRNKEVGEKSDGRGSRLSNSTAMLKAQLVGR